MFEELESFGSESKSESESETESSQYPRSIRNSISVSQVVNKEDVSTPPSFDVLFSEFNNMNAFAYSSCFIKVSKYPEWIANVVPVLKKYGRVRMCVDYRDLNKASPKDDFPLPHIDILVDDTANHALLSFMDGYAGYNQIFMAESDKEKTTGTYCYIVMPFGLKNAGATYQRAATALLHDMMHKEGHTVDLRKFFERLRKYNMRLNLAKCAFAVTFGKLLGYVISSRGIEIDPAKIKAIMSLPPPKTEKQIRGFIGRLQYISRFISKLTTICEPIFKKLKKDVPITWDDDCKLAFDKIKAYLANPPVLAPALPNIPLRLYLIVTKETMGAMLAQEIEGKENVVYYLSKKMLSYETRYTPLEKLCLALVWATKKLRHYMLTHTLHVVSRIDPLKYLFKKETVNGRLSRWIVMLSEFDLKFVPQKAIKGSVVSDFLVDFPIEDFKEANDEANYDFPDEELMVTEDDTWVLYFDGASNKKGCGVGVLLVSPTEEHVPISIKVDFDVTNNAAEYEACIVGLETALALGIKKLRVYGDSSLIINQISKKWKVRSESLAPYQAYLETLTDQLEKVDYSYLPREENQFADALVRLAAMVRIPKGTEQMPLIIEKKHAPAYIQTVEDDDTQEPWYTDILNYVAKGEYPPNTDKRARRALRSSQYVLINGNLHKRVPNGRALLCASHQEAQRIMRIIHKGVCGTHMNGKMLVQKIIRQGYYWTTMERDCHQHVKRCHKYQIYANLKHVPPLLLYTYTSPWPFSTWGIDIIGKIHPPGTGGHEFILVAIDYSTKWVEATSHAKLQAKHVALFIERNIICRYGVSHEMISDNGTHFQAECAELLQKYGIQYHLSSPYRPQTNGVVEAANKNLKVIIEKMTEKYKDWPSKLPYALWGTEPPFAHPLEPHPSHWYMEWMRYSPWSWKYCPCYCLGKSVR
ncbi:uncharacterized protein LOC110713176 [Chenopodium quinoa]|uniref:uncharacterized protein LOC110713176 n=1 Tax=Chenopodium quinoa TaxID=63459 RepID=UPI000B7842C1|nr:uncharacterized protein LOC110713176 [Chenopodium quinoa]